MTPERLAQIRSWYRGYGSWGRGRVIEDLLAHIDELEEECIRKPAEALRRANAAEMEAQRSGSLTYPYDDHPFLGQGQ